MLVETIEADPYPYSPRIRVSRTILAKFGELGPQPPPPARPPQERDMGRAPRLGRRRRQVALIQRPGHGLKEIAQALGVAKRRAHQLLTDVRDELGKIPNDKIHHCRTEEL